MEDIFKGLKVIELANVLAGPAVGMFFAELGAEVIKIENSKGGDVTRSWKLPSEDKSSLVSAYYASVNWNKQSIFLDLTINDDREKVYELIRTADVVISNYKPGDDVKLGMDEATLRNINPSLIYSHITGFGPDSHRTAYDLVLQAETGYMYMNGTPESGPLKMPVALIDVLAAHQLKEAILIALIKKARTGNGSSVFVSLYDAAIASLSNQATNWLMAGHDAKASGSLHPNIAPYGETFITKDNKKIVLAVGNDKQFRNLCTCLELKELINDPRFSVNSERVKNRTELYRLLEPSFKISDASELMKIFISLDIPAGLIRSVKEIFTDPAAEKYILTSKADHSEKRVKTIAFKIK